MTIQDLRDKKMNKGKIGVPLSHETKKKISEKSKRKGRKLNNIECPHCGKFGKGGNMTRYHFEKCKLKLNDN